MKYFNLLWFKSVEEKDKAVLKVKEILESVNMHPEGIAHFLNSEELVWNVYNYPDEVINWEKHPYSSPLSKEREYHILALVITEIS